MSRTWKALVVLAAVGGLYQVGVAASGSGAPSPSPMSAGPTITPEQQAIGVYNNGISHRDKGNKFEEQAAVQQAPERDKTVEKARDEFEKALKDFKRATELSPKMYQAYNGMGYAYRKTGDYQKALEMYDKALAMAPGFPDAMEYRAEAYLALNRVDDAKQAYLALFATDRAQADLLMKAMATWLEKRRADPAGIDPAVLSGFETWMQERAKLAATTQAMALKGNRSIWN